MFFPAQLTVGAVVLSLLIVAIDRSVVEYPAWLGWVYGGGADGARALLSAVAGSMITVVSVTFSVMVVALTGLVAAFRPASAAQLHARPAGAARARPVHRHVRLIGSERSLDKDAGFAVQQLVEIALRALSPGVNEPFTAVAAIDWLGGSLTALATRQIPGAVRTDDAGRVRIVSAPRTFSEFLKEAFEPIALNAGKSPAVVLRLLDALLRLASVAQRAEDRQAIDDLSRTVWTLAAREIPDQPQRGRSADRLAGVKRTLDRRAVSADA